MAQSQRECLACKLRRSLCSLLSCPNSFNSFWLLTKTAPIRMASFRAQSAASVAIGRHFRNSACSVRKRTKSFWFFIDVRKELIVIHGLGHFWRCCNCIILVYKEAAKARTGEPANEHSMKKDEPQALVTGN